VTGLVVGGRCMRWRIVRLGGDGARGGEGRGGVGGM
jgi:hypothetical protein